MLFGLLEGFLWGMVGTIEAHELSTYAGFGEVIDLNAVGDLVFFYLYFILREDFLGGLGGLPIDTDVAFLAGLGIFCNC